MPDLQTPPSENSSTSPPTDAPDPLAHLHKMSTTAGLGTTEYVAINGPSVVAVILGLASALAIVDKTLLIVPLAGVICSIVALRQIGKSAGTQTGRGLAVLGLLLSLGFAGYVGYMGIAKASQEKSDKAAIEAIIVELTGYIQKGEFDKAYNLFSPRFQERVPLQRFKDVMGYVKSHPQYGNLKGMTTNGRYAFDSDENTGIRIGQVILLMNLDKFTEPSRQDAVFRVVGGQWKIENIPGLFPAPQGQGG